MTSTMLNLRRMTYTDRSTIGELTLDGVFQCFTLEDTCRADGIKIYGKTAIPAGCYEIIVTKSKRFNRDLPLLLEVPGYESIRIHPGNTPENTDGCILVGNTKETDRIGSSIPAFEKLLPKITERLKLGKVFVDIHGGREKTLKGELK